ncbi:MAG: phosphoglucosamine mutase [Deltaproteobacteria bacterium RIFCSPLOWO2_02_FULL_47_10]|nr:MAG: phosphoglucosamine mutase [Deltaproteobacteria bacterium RIFCSPLOWO2_02_FULL_47_10]
MQERRKIFGTDGVRGTANIHPMTSELALQLGRAVSYVFKNGRKRHGIVIGKDTRLSGYMLETALASGICSMGSDVMLVGPLPTPGIAFITQGMRADAGVVISASHNPYQDNGIKFFDRNGFKLPDELEAQMEQLISSGEIDSHRPTADGIGKALRIDDASGRYIEFLKRTIPRGVNFNGLKIVLDCGNGAGYKIAPAVLAELGAQVIAIGVNPDGKNINNGCGSLHPELMAKVVVEQHADLGIALDGDADRIIMADEKGSIVDGDYILALCAQHFYKTGQLAKGTVVATVMSNLGLDLAMQSMGIKVERSSVGDRHVIQTMRTGGYNLGGEQSGHIIFLDHNTTGDGTLAGLQVLSILREKNQPLSIAKQVFTPFPQLLTNIKVKQKKDFSQIPAIASSVRNIERELGKRGRLVLRYSGTEMLARIMIEGENHDRIRSMADGLAEEINKHLGR